MDKERTEAGTAEDAVSEEGTWLRYVPKDQIADYESKGWTVHPGLEGTHHGYHAVFMVAPDV
jgi:hypothetical protein